MYLMPACPVVKRWTALYCLGRQACMVGALYIVASLTLLRRIEWALP